MREIFFIFALILSLFPIVGYTKKSMDIDCWSSQQKIYQGKGYDVMYGDGFIVFDDASSKKTIYVSGDCVISFEPSKKHYVNKKGK